MLEQIKKKIKFVLLVLAIILIFIMLNRYINSFDFENYYISRHYNCVLYVIDIGKKKHLEDILIDICTEKDIDRANIKYISSRYQNNDIEKHIRLLQYHFEKKNRYPYPKGLFYVYNFSFMKESPSIAFHKERNDSIVLVDYADSKFFKNHHFLKLKLLDFPGSLPEYIWFSINKKTRISYRLFDEDYDYPPLSKRTVILNSIIQSENIIISTENDALEFSRFILNHFFHSIILEGSVEEITQDGKKVSITPPSIRKDNDVFRIQVDVYTFFLYEWNSEISSWNITVNRNGKLNIKKNLKFKIPGILSEIPKHYLKAVSGKRKINKVKWKLLKNYRLKIESN